MHCRNTVENLFCASFYLNFFQFLNSLFFANLNAQSWLRILRPKMFLSCEKHIIPVFWTNMEIHFTFGQDAMFHFGSTCYKKIIHKKMKYSCHWISCSWTSCNRIQHILQCSIFFCPHTRFRWDVACAVPLCRVILVSGSLTRPYVGTMP